MKILVFAAAVTAVQSAAIGRLVKALRDDGHSVGERSLPHFRLEKEPADAIVIALTPEQAKTYRNNGLELVAAWSGPGVDVEELFHPLELPSDPADLEDFDFSDFVDELSGESKAGFMTMDQARAEAVERGLEVNSQTSREALEHMLGLDIHPGGQADDRVTDERNNLNNGDQRIGLRTQSTLPTVNGLDLTRMNDEQLRAAASQMNLKVSPGMSRKTIINKMTQVFAAKVAEEGKQPGEREEGKDPEGANTENPGASAGAGGQAPSGPNGLGTTGSGPVGTDTGQADQPAPLEGKTIEQLTGIAKDEGIDLGGKTLKADIVSVIEDARKAKSNG